MPAISLRALLILASLLVVLGTGLSISTLAFYSERQAVNELTTQAIQIAHQRIMHQLDDTLFHAAATNRRLQGALRAGVIALDRPQQLLRYLVQQHLQNPALTALMLGAPDGLFLISYQEPERAIQDGSALVGPSGFPYNASYSDPQNPQLLHIHAVEPDGQIGEHLHLLEGLNVLQRPWYQQAAQNLKPGWTEPFAIAATQLLTLNAYQPSIDAQGQLQAVFSVNLSLNQLNTLLKDIAQEIAGESFIIDQQGLLVADSLGLAAYEAHYELASDPIEGQVQFRRVAALESPQPLVRAAAEFLNPVLDPANALNAAFQGQSRLAGENYFINLSPYQGIPSLGWSVVSLVPRAHVMAGTQQRFYYTLGLCALALTLVALLASYLASRIAHPLMALSHIARAAQVSTALAALPQSRIHEIDHLRATLQHSVDRLDESFRILRERERTLKTFIEAVPMGISVHNRHGKAVLLNRMGRKYLTGDPDSPTMPIIEGFFLADSNDPYPMRHWPVMRGLRGEQVSGQNLDIQVQGRRIPLEVHTIPVRDERGDVAFAIAAFQVVSERRQAEALRNRYQQELEQQVSQRTAALAESEARFREIAATVEQVFFIRTTPARDFLYISPAFEKIWGYPVEDLYQQPDLWLNTIHPSDLPTVESSREAHDRGESTVREYRILRRDGRWRWIRVQVSPILDIQGHVSRIIGIAEDISNRKQIELDLQTLNEKLQHLATVDSLTGVANRRHLEAQLDREWQRLQRESGDLSLIMLDVDYFKAYNDHYGHPQGDSCLQQVAAVLQQSMRRPGDLVGRYGGEEFLIVLPNTDALGAQHLAETIRTLLASLAIPHASSGVSAHVTVSMGIATTRVHPDLDPEGLIHRADSALYTAKQRRNSVVLEGAPLPWSTGL